MSLIRKEKRPVITEKLESVKTAAARLGVSRETVIRLIGRGELRATDDKPIMVNSADVTARIRRMYSQAGVTELA